MRYDGGNIRLSVNGGPFTPVRGPRCTAHGYDGVIAGHGILLDQEAFNAQSPGYATSAFVKDIVVHESWRRRGLGEALLLEAFRTFERRGASHVGLKVQAGNASAIALYERVGMMPV